MKKALRKFMSLTRTAGVKTVICFVIFGLVFTNLLSAQSSKKGLCLRADCPDFYERVYKLHPVWHYNWDIYTAPVYPANIEFVPLIRSDYSNSFLNNFLKNGTFNHMLGYNEPDNVGQDVIDPIVAANNWPVITNGLTYQIVSPVPTQTPWLDSFLGQAGPSSVNYIAIHWYGPDFTSFQTRMKALHSKYPNYAFWITEFASTSASQDDALNFMKSALAWMESTSYIYRYAWFSYSKASSGLAGACLYSDDGSLNKLGEYYANFTQPAPAPNQPLVNPILAFSTYHQETWGVKGLKPTTISDDILTDSLKTSGATIFTSGNANLWGGNGWSTATDLQAAVTENKYIQFSVTVRPNKILSISKLGSFKATVSSNGPSSIRLQYSVDNGTTFKGMWNDTIVRPASGQASLTFKDTNLGIYQELQNLTAGKKVIFRIVPYNSGAASGTFFIGDGNAGYHLGLEAQIGTQISALTSDKILAAWNTFGQQNGGVDNLAPSTVDENVVAMPLMKASGLRGTDVTDNNLFGARTTSSKSLDAGSALYYKKFITVTLKPQPGKLFSLKSIAPFKVSIGSTGPNHVVIQYVVNSGDYINLTDITITSVRPNTLTSYNIGSVDLSNIPDFQAVGSKAISFRLVPYNAADTGPTSQFYIGDGSNSNSFTINGSTSTSADQQTIVSWNTSKLVNAGPNPAPPTYTDARINAVGLSRGNSITITGSAPGFWGGKNWTTSTTAPITVNRYFTVKVGAKPGHTLSLKAVNPTIIDVENLGPQKFLFEYSFDNVNFTGITTLSISPPTAFTRYVLDKIDLSNIAALQNIPENTMVTIKVTPFQAASSSAYFYIGDTKDVDHFSLNGVVDSVEAPPKIVAWNLLGQTAGGLQALAPKFQNDNVNVTGLTRAGHLSTTGATEDDTWGATSWWYSTNSQTDAINNYKHFIFAVTPKTGYTMSIKKLDSIAIKINKDGPIHYGFQWEINGVAHDLASYTTTRPTADKVFHTPEIDLSGIAQLQNVAAGTTVKIRVIPYYALNNTGAMYIGRAGLDSTSIALSGYVSSTSQGFASMANNTQSVEEPALKIQDSKKDKNILLYPDPVENGLATFTYPVTTEDATLKIFNLYGTLIKTYTLQKGSNNYQLELGFLKSGIYLISYTVKSKVQTIRFIKH